MLFLDELPEFAQGVLGALREPLETRAVSLLINLGVNLGVTSLRVTRMDQEYQRLGQRLGWYPWPPFQSGPFRPHR